MEAITWQARQSFVTLSFSFRSPGLPDFFLVQHTKTGKMFQNGNKIYQMDKEY
jgi:hypothetical protein